MTASEDKEIVRKLRRAAEGNLPSWARLDIGMDEIADLLLLVDTITDLRKNEEVRARIIRELRAAAGEPAEAFTALRKACDELLATLDRIAGKERSDVVYIPPEHPLEAAHKRGRAAGFARSAEIARSMIGGEGRV